MSGAMADIDNGLDQTEDEGQRWIAENMQGLYQELGLDPIVANLDLDRVNPHLRQLARATQASAVSSLMELGGCVRTDSTVAGSPSKRPRGPNGFHIPEALEPANKARRETPVRKRINVDGSPTSKRGMGDLDSPSCHDFGTPGPTIAWTPRQSPRSRHDDDSLHAVAALLATPTKNRGIKPAHKKNGKHSPASDDEAAHSPPPAASAGAAGGKASRPNGAPASTPGNSSLLLNDKDKKNQGLRQFSLRVCRQVEAKMTTTYNEVADELVKEFKDEETDSDEKNIRRRAYDALNVLTAMDIISKDKKDIQWKGFPPMVGDRGERAAGASSAGRDKEKARLKSKIDQKSKDLKQKEEQLKELVNQFVSLKQLLSRNAKPEYSENADQLHRIYLPFVIVNTDADNTIECDISTDKRSAEFNCTKPFKLYDDRETLSLMRMGQVDQESIAKMLPDPGLLDFLRQNHQQQTVYSAVGAVISDPNYDEEDMDDDDQ